MAKMSIIPAPLSQQFLPGQYVLPAEALLTFDCEELKGIASQAAEELQRRYGVQARVQLANVGSGTGTVHFSRQVPLDAARSDIPHQDEAYELTVTPGSVTVVGAAPAGVFYGLQSLLMLLPPLPPPDGQDIAIPATKVRVMGDSHGIVPDHNIAPSSPLFPRRILPSLPALLYCCSLS